MRFLIVSLLAIFTLAIPSSEANAQAISGYSVAEEAVIPVTCPGSTQICYQSVVEDYVDTEEDYTASLYYNVEGVSAFYGPAAQLINYGDLPGNPGSIFALYNGYTNAQAADDGIFSEFTDHYLDFYYITSAGYYDPYNYSGIVSAGGDWDSGFWLRVDVWGTYIAEASVLLGETYSVLNHNTPNSGAGTGNARAFSVMYQTYIPDEWIYGPTDAVCPDPHKIYQGDWRQSNPNLGSYRTFQQITLGVGGLTLPSQPGTEDTGFTHRFAPDSIDAQGHITQAARQDTVTGDCHYLEAVGHASTSSMMYPTPSYSGGTASTNFIGDAGNPLEPSPAISWNANINISESTPTTLSVSGTVTHDCYPAHEISVGQNDVYWFQPPLQSSFTDIGLCLAGVGQISAPISRSFVIAPF
jgi:hypothetical protein